MAQQEENRRTKRLMTTPVFEGFATEADVSMPEHGLRPQFARKNYDSKGFEKKAPVEEEKKKEEEQQSFFSKYWMYILIAFMVLPRLFEPPQEGGQGGG